MLKIKGILFALACSALLPFSIAQEATPAAPQTQESSPVTAQAQTATPAAPKKYLGDRHVERGLQCDACHGATTPSAQLPVDENRHQYCVNCHGFYDEVVKRTVPEDEEDVNPHSQHDGNLPCTQCHKGHQESVNYCGKCHMYTFTVP